MPSSQIIINPACALRQDALPVPTPARRLFAHLLLPYALALSLPALAQTDALTELTELSIEELMAVPVVGASRYEQQQDQVGAAVTVITRDEIRTFGWRTLDEALATLPGVYTTYDRQYSYVGVRGFGLPGDYMTRMLISIDGMRLNEPIYDSAPFGRMLPLDMDLVERIEFIPGPGGAVYGQNAMFGVVNVITRKGAALDGGELALAWQAPQSARQARISWGKRLQSGLELMVSAKSLRADGDDLWIDFGERGSGVARGLDGERDEEFNLTANYGTWSFGLAHGDRRKDDPSAVYGSDPFASGNFQNDRYTAVQLGYRSALSSTLSMSARVFLGDYRFDSTLIFDALPYGYPTTAHWYGTELQLISTAVAAHTLMVGVEYQRDQRLTQEILDYAKHNSDYNWIDRRDGARTGIHVQDEWHLSDALSTTVGLRADHNELTGTKLSPRLALIWKASAQTALKLLYGRAHRAPNAYEAYYDEEGLQNANPGLSGETVDTFEIVADHRVSPELHLRASLYQWEIDELISLVTPPDSEGDAQYQNAGTVTSRGLELSANRSWRNGARLRANLSFQNATAAGQRVANSPRVLGRLNFSAPLPSTPLRTGLEFAYDGDRRGASAGTVDANWRANLHLVAERRIPSAQVSLSVLNLFDTNYAHPSAGMPTHWGERFEQDGRSLRLKFDYRF